jgi:glycerol-3-phosphate dehydrogenase
MAELDLIIVGGGINGVGVARDAAQRGLRVALFEQKDLSAGASGASSGMIHGGGRYLRTDRPVTRKSCVDAGFIRQMAPHLLFRIPFLFPILSSTPWARSLHELAFTYFKEYARFGVAKGGKAPAKLTAEGARNLEPGLSPNTIGAVTTDEWAVNVARLCVLNALDAQAHGAQIFLRHRVEAFVRADDGRVLGVRVRDLLTGHTREVRARMTLNAAGAWAQRLAGLADATVRLRPGKGIHVVFSRRIVNYALLVDAVDGRQVFLEPYGQETWIGTTDTDYHGDPGEVRADRDEVEYLMDAVERVFPRIREHRLVRAFAGVRPTLYGFGKDASHLSREHAIFDHALEGADGLMSLAGGKLAAYRIMAEETTDAICGRLGHSGVCRTHLTTLPGGDWTPDVADVAAEAGIDHYAAARMIHRHGSRSVEIVERIKRDPTERRILCACEPVTEAEARFCIETEWVTTLEDLRRRTNCGGGPCQGSRCARRAAWILAGYQGGGRNRADALLARFVTARWREQAPIAGPQSMAQFELMRWALRRSES